LHHYFYLSNKFQKKRLESSDGSSEEKLFLAKTALKVPDEQKEAIHNPLDEINALNHVVHNAFDDSLRIGLGMGIESDVPRLIRRL
jgi:hypothetical protein